MLKQAGVELTSFEAYPSSTQNVDFSACRFFLKFAKKTLPYVFFLSSVAGFVFAGVRPFQSQSVFELEAVLAPLQNEWQNYLDAWSQEGCESRLSVQPAEDIVAFCNYGYVSTLFGRWGTLRDEICDFRGARPWRMVGHPHEDRYGETLAALTTARHWETAGQVGQWCVPVLLLVVSLLLVKRKAHAVQSSLEVTMLSPRGGQ